MAKNMAKNVAKNDGHRPSDIYKAISFSNFSLGYFKLIKTFKQKRGRGVNEVI
jgi:hypothetical protein